MAKKNGHAKHATATVTHHEYVHQPFGCLVTLTAEDFGGSAILCVECRRYDAPEKFVAKDED